jgi:hypothetical protein
VAFDFDSYRIFVGSYLRFDLVGNTPPFSFRTDPERQRRRSGGTLLSARDLMETFEDICDIKLQGLRRRACGAMSGERSYLEQWIHDLGLEKEWEDALRAAYISDLSISPE